MQDYCWLDPWKHISAKLKLKYNNQIETIFIQENDIENVVCEKGAILSRLQYVNGGTIGSLFPADASNGEIGDAIYHY